MVVELLLHVTHISGTRIQTYIVDILSKYNTLEWVIAGNKLIASFSVGKKQMFIWVDHVVVVER